MEHKEKNLAFLKSALTIENSLMPGNQFLNWIKDRNKRIPVRINPIPLNKLRLWHFDEHTGNLVHDSGKFFSIEGIRLKTNWGKVFEWEQPIINQPEIGILGILVKRINGILNFLMQAKVEPGNLNVVQLAPTLQATRSNYTQVHKGIRPRYLEYFNGEKKVNILLDQLQSEQGARFLRKRNRNIIIEIDEKEPIEMHDDFCWLTLGQLKYFLQYDNLINMDTRTVIAGIPFGDYPGNVIDFYETLELKHKTDRKESGMLVSMLDHSRHLYDIDDIISWITRQKSIFDLNLERIPLKTVKNWIIDENEIYHQHRKYFSVIGMNVAIGNREVKCWDQPIVMAAQEGIIAFIIKKIDGIYHFLVQAKLEAGNFDIIELAPTVQCLTGNYRKGENEYEVDYLDQVLNAKPEQIWYSSYQSEEGGRFYKEQNKNMIIEAGEEFPVEVPERFFWMTLNQLMTFIRYNNYLNIAARSLLAAIRFI